LSLFITWGTKTQPSYILLNKDWSGDNVFKNAFIIHFASFPCAKDILDKSLTVYDSQVKEPLLVNIPITN
jgi:hypothetical protein